MFAETIKYKNKGHFTFKKGGKLSHVSKEVPKLPGIYYIVKIVKDVKELVYIGKAGTMRMEGTFSAQSLKGRINNKHGDVKRQIYFENKYEAEQIDSLEVYWFVTFDENHNDLPGFVEGLLIQRYYEKFDSLPLWNKEF